MTRRFRSLPAAGHVPGSPERTGMGSAGPFRERDVSGREVHRRPDLDLAPHEYVREEDVEEIWGIIKKA